MDTTAVFLAAVRVGEPIAEFTRTTDLRQGPVATPGRTAVAFRIMLDGSCRVTPLRDAPGSFAPFVLETGDMALFGPGVGHGMSAIDPEARSVYGGYLLGRRRPRPALPSLPGLTRVSMQASCPVAFQGLVAMLGVELDQRPPGSTELTPPLADAVMVYALRTWLRHRAHDGTWSLPDPDPVLTPAIHAMHDRMEHPWTVAEMASVSGLSRAAFARRFTTLVGESPLAYLTDLRLSKASRLLRQTDESIARIAEAVGYGSQSALTRAFRREEGVTPGEYRTRRT